ncbi:hypothetical protein ACFPPA_05655 [Rhodanobacter ginsengisoli]|uniref:Holin n=1 Tax=Rhodanobacter ginsengisoli TaxID=418646 RepID=A0ABW0QJU1_9GAMM
MTQAGFKDFWATLALAVVVGLLLAAKLTGEEFVNAFTWLVSVYLLGQAAGIVAQGWMAQSVTKVQLTAQAAVKPREASGG